jgi:hypothetical protein
MEERNHTRLAELIASAGSGMGSLFPRCWPGGFLDRRDPLGAEWLRRAGFRPAIAELPECTCAQGRCEICN